MQVGSVVRVRLSDKASRRAVLATLPDNADGSSSSSAACCCCCILWEDDAPRPILPQDDGDAVFLVTPHFKHDDHQQVECEEITETTVAVSELMPLLDFETKQRPTTTGTAPVLDWKECGDQLLRIGDAAAAVPYYERALRLTSPSSVSQLLQIVGATVLLKESGRVVAADVDCIDDDHGECDVTVVETGHEKSVRASDILLCLLPLDDDHVQERILLNLARCLLQLAEPTTTRTSCATNRRRPRCSM